MKIRKGKGNQKQKYPKTKTVWSGGYQTGPGVLHGNRDCFSGLEGTGTLLTFVSPWISLLACLARCILYTHIPLESIALLLDGLLCLSFRVNPCRRYNMDFGTIRYSIYF